jgi:hypothetical protein
MASAGQDGQDPTVRAMRALERGATTLGVQAARAIRGRWRRMPAARRARLEGLAADVRRRVAAGTADSARAHPVLPPAPAASPPDSALDAAELELTEIEVRDLRAELARELERIAGADIGASRGRQRL